MSGVGEAWSVGSRLVKVHGFRRAVAMVARKWLRKVRHERPPNTTDANREVWDTHDWSQGGDEWTPSQEWKDAVLEELLSRYIPERARVLEIGPGAGRWTEHLLKRCSALDVVDVSPVCISLCRERFGHDSRIAYHVNDGTSLEFLRDASIDAVWSFDVFVHIAAVDVERYLSQLPRILSPGGIAVIHHSAEGVQRKSWRSDMTAEKMREIAGRCRLEVLSQTATLKDGRINVYARGGPGNPDVVSVLRMRGAAAGGHA